MSIRDELWDVAVDQYGYVTTADAARLAVALIELAKMSKRGTLDRISQGVYRFPQWPVSANDHLMEAVLWTRDPTAVLSHDTALDVLDLCDINPTTLHLTISNRRFPIRRREMPDDLVLHYENLGNEQRGWWEQIPTVTAGTAIEQGIRTAVRPDLLGQAIDTAHRRAMIDTDTANHLRDILEGKYR
ncbi:MAG: type IV toxin-antitoxin system AbiEi family antitoxin domain-containing protein [Propionibacteriaceae bacterium]|jgi:predicted transcriptional regulator of viral defense system|nr:type IV toxin-antitoxin system AbiEi family antitoxin domain-containing protein [Propionibacteriaceae bacterium]